MKQYALTSGRIMLIAPMPIGALDHEVVTPPHHLRHHQVGPSRTRMVNAVIPRVADVSWRYHSARNKTRHTTSSKH